MSAIKTYLLGQYPHGLPKLTDFCRDNPDLLPLRTARNWIDTLAAQPPEVARCFKKRGGSQARTGRWHIDVVAFAEMMADERPILESNAA